MQVKGEINAPISLSIHPNCVMPNGHSTDNEKGLSACVKLAQFVVGMEYFSMRELGQTGVEMHYCSGEDRSIGFESPPQKKDTNISSGSSMENFNTGSSVLLRNAYNEKV